ncbi:MAG TPA: type VI secretion system baseplate subunit TssK, partial [Coxiellaceae bacterium]|nr:type VI secretion system baseplate subunit TssK [Coxiellaceae bacterium]
QDRYHERQNVQLIKTFHNYYWGFSTLHYNQEAFSKGYLALENAQGIFPDGTSFNIPDQDSSPDLLNLNRLRAGDQIYLGFRNNASHTKQNLELRDLIEENQELRQIEVYKLKLELYVKSSESNDLTYLEVARIIANNETSSLAFDPNFTPPSLNIKINQNLLTKLKLLLAEIENLIKNNLSSQNKGLSDPLIQTLNKYLARINHQLKLTPLHPEKLYLSLIELEAELKLFHSGKEFDAHHYEHDNLFNCFTKILTEIENSLNLSSKTNFIEIKLKENHHGFWVNGELNKDWLRNDLVLSIDYETDTQISTDYIIKNLKIGTPNTIQNLIRQALPGIGFTELNKNPPFIPYSKRNFLFLISKNSFNWQELVLEEAIVIHGTDNLGRFKARLWSLPL